MNRQGPVQTQQTNANAAPAGRILQRKCNCGNHTVAGGQCAECTKAKEVRQGGGQWNESSEVGLHGVRQALSLPGSPLDPQTRAFMESRFTNDFSAVRSTTGPALASRLSMGASHDVFEREAEVMADRVTGSGTSIGKGQDFSGVRIHTHPGAAASARSLNAHAYTVGRDIVFAAGQYAPHTLTGRRLLAHELTHVQQQSRFGERIQRDGDKAAKPETVHYRVKIPPGVSSKEEFRRYAETVIFGRAVNKSWNANSGASKVYEDIAKHVGTEVEFEVPVGELAQFGKATDPTLKVEKKAGDQAYGALLSTERQGINDEIDKRYYASEGLDPTSKIKAGESGKIAIWNSFKQQVMGDKRKIDALPPEIRKFLSEDNADLSIDPKDFEQVLRIISKISALSPAELEEYKSRVTAKTANWSVYEASVDRFIAERHEREATAKERRRLETRLYDLKSLYIRYRALPGLKDAARALTRTRGVTGSLAQAAWERANKAENDLTIDLDKSGFPGGIAEFRALIEDYEKVFERETLAVSKVMLDQYEHLLWAQEQRYQKSAVTDDLYEQINKTQARVDYEEADKIRSEHAQMPMTPDEMAEQSYWVGQRNAALVRGEQKVRSTPGSHPLLSEDKFPRERLARASNGEVQPLMLGYIAERRKDIADTRQNLEDKPTMIYGLDKLIEASFKAQNIQSDTIYELIVRDHIREVHFAEAIPQIVLGVVAIAAGLLSGGSGTVAVLAAGTAFGIGAYQAIEEFRRYEMKTAASSAKLTSEDPSLAWVIVAVVGAGIDAASFAMALPKLRGALQAFNAGTDAGDVAALGKRLETLSEVREDIRNAIRRAADAEAEARAAWKGVLRPAGMYSYIVPYADYFGRFVHAVYLSVIRGIREFQVFVKTNEAIELIGDVSKLTAEELAAVKAGYLKAIEELETVAAHGKALGMADNEISAFMNLRGKTRGMTVEQLVKEMDAWKATKSSGTPFGFDTAEKFQAFKAAAEKSLRKARYADAEAILQGSSASGISYSKQIPFGAHSDLDVAVAGRSVFEKARKLGYEIKSGPMRIGPLTLDQIKDLDLGSMHRALTEAADGREVNLLLFGNRNAALQGIAGIKPESIPFK